MLASKDYPSGSGGPKSVFNAGVLEIQDSSKNVIYSIDEANRKVTFPSGSNLEQHLVVNLAAATQALTAAKCGQTFVGLVDAVFTLPAVAAGLKGLWYRFVTGALSVGTGLSISPSAADHIYGRVLAGALTTVDDKDLINTAATDVIGDTTVLVCDGVNWLVIEDRGVWAKEA